MSASLDPSPALVALRAAEAFIAGFEDDEHQDVGGSLAMVRAAIRCEEGPTGTPSRDLMGVRRFLEVSTGHLSPKTRTWLAKDRENAPLSIGVAPTECGWFVFAPTEAMDRPADPDEGVPADLWAVQACARMLGCDIVMFDRDVERVEWLPWFGAVDGVEG